MYEGAAGCLKAGSLGIQSAEVGQCPGNEGRANGARLPEVIDDLICKRSFVEFGASSHVNVVPLLNDFDVA